jgi:hypothetical protein
MIECGLGVIVVCLPTLRSLFGRWTLKILSPGSILSSIRNSLPLQSSSSNREQRGGRFYTFDKTDNPPYLLSNIHTHSGLEEGTIQTHIVRASDLEGRESVGSGIRLKREVEQFVS